MQIEPRAFPILLFAFLLLMGCGAKTTEQLSQPAPVTKETPEEGMLDETIRLGDKQPIPLRRFGDRLKDVEAMNVEPTTVVVFMKRTGCYGTCPVYQFQLQANGLATYQGKANVELEGKYTTQLSQQQVLELQLLAYDHNYFSLAKQYPTDGSFLADLPNTETMVLFRGRQRQVVNNHNAPRALVDFEKRLEAVIASLDWRPAVSD